MGVNSFNDPPETTSGLKVSRRRFLKVTLSATGFALAGGLSTFQLRPAGAATITQKRIYIAADDHTDYMWSADEPTYQQALLDMTDHNLNLTDSTIGNASPYQNRWNCDGSFWMWTYEKNKSLADFENRFIARLRSGHLSVPLTTLVGCYGGTPLEAVLRGLYYAGRIERRYGLRFPLAVAMENQTLPYGLGSLWAGAGAKYSWRGICNCATKTPDAGNREHEIYWWGGPDGSHILMKWHSLSTRLRPNPAYSSFYGTGYPQPNGEPYSKAYQDPNENIGGYAEARYPFEVVDFVDTDATFQTKYPYKIIGVFGQGWDDVKTLTNVFVPAAKHQTNADRQVIVSNETDFFQDFEANYGAGLPTQSVTFGNEWELYSASMQEVTSSVKRATEHLRAAEALATLVSLQNPGFLMSRQAARDQAFVNFGLYWEHAWTGDGPVHTSARADWQRRIAKGITDYVGGLQTDSAAALGMQITNTATDLRFFAFNPLGWTRTDPVDFLYTGATPVHVIDLATGLETPSQIVTVNGQQYLRVLAQNLPAVGYKTFEVHSGAGASFPAAATVTGTVIESANYKITVAADGAITSLLDKTRGSREMVAQTAQTGRSKTVRINDLGYNVGSNFTSTVRVKNAGPVSVTLVIFDAGADVPLDHVSRVTLIAGSPRIELRNDINENFSAVNVWGFGFNLTNPDVWTEEVGALIRAKLVADGGHYSPRNARYDWTSLNHFADMTGSEGVGVTLSSPDCQYVKLGNSTVGSLDTATAILSPLVGGQVDGSGLGVSGQNGDSHFLQRFALRTHGAFSPTDAMRFALEHQNPPVTGAVASGSGRRPYPEKSYSLLTVSDRNVLLWSVKPAEEGIAQGIITRLWNLSGAPVSFTLTLAGGIASAARTTHIETDLSAATVSGGALSAIVGAKQVQTYRLHSPASMTVPVAPPGLTANAGGRRVFLAWNASAGATGYNVHRGKSGVTGKTKVSQH